MFDVIHKKIPDRCVFWNMDLNKLLKPTVRKEQNDSGIFQKLVPFSYP